jgi:hypothetical protein
MPIMQEIDGQMYHVSLEEVELHKHDIKVFPPTSLVETDLCSLSLSQRITLPADKIVSITCQLILRFAIHRTDIPLFHKK